MEPLAEHCIFIPLALNCHPGFFCFPLLRGSKIIKENFGLPDLLYEVEVTKPQRGILEGSLAYRGPYYSGLIKFKEDTDCELRNTDPICGHERCQ